MIEQFCILKCEKVILKSQSFSDRKLANVPSDHTMNSSERMRPASVTANNYSGQWRKLRQLLIIATSRDKTPTRCSWTIYEAEIAGSLDRHYSSSLILRRENFVIRCLTVSHGRCSQYEPVKSNF